MDRYEASANRGEPIQWPGGARIAVWLVPNIEFYELDPPANPARAAWHRPAPDVLAYSRRDFGNRVGLWRLMDSLDRHQVRASVSLNAAVCDHFPEIVRECVNRRWELLSHGIYNTRLLFGMDEAQVREVIRDSVETIRRCSGQQVAGFLGPAISFTETMLDLLPECGISYSIDLVPDDRPVMLKLRSGQLVCVPYSSEINDIRILGFRSYSAAQWAAMVTAAFDQLYEEGERDGTVLCIPLHPFIIGQAHCIDALDTVLDHIGAREAVWFATGREIAAHYAAHVGAAGQFPLLAD
ncbi:polysaccharide deacetylase family protein [Novosphingobium album (ex Liu et al. 2023)]|uniref:Chitooligosaccharide deacetylase n=1 Tax=Novosphingobium album (ex Liu et al. 2023) TaxID=3031130 RepID=A0ABT5WQF7_9SPHN|nr:polysaccharide deacetylase family protein [Novosphingobium album (ex Liu et al. 2023)]MDE8651522.1 polysaccharide deacetylase family protein [Novosphingobium album (ex Liu et al. 2023)]